ncbi:MAG: DNA sulfur modification protein DndB [Conexibacter sp.]
MAFEPREVAGESFDHLDDRVRELMPARGTIQREFFHRAMKAVRVIDPETGEKRTERQPTGWAPTAKYKNATGELQKYIQGPFLETPPLEATLPSFTIYFPERLEGVEVSDFNARMGGEYHVYTLDPAKKAMEADGESRLLAIRRALSVGSKLSGTKQEKLRTTLVSVDVIHGVPTAAMGQMFADLNGKGVKLTKNEIEGLNIRDPWTRATKDIFGQLRVPLVTTGRQATAVNQAANKHLVIGQAVMMVRGLGLGFSRAVQATSYDEVIKDQKDYDRLVEAGVTWFGHVLDHFGAPALSDGTRDARVFTDPDRVVRAVSVKVALGVMGNPWFEVNRPKQDEHKRALGEIDWRVSEAWQNIAGKVSQKVELKRVDGKTVRVPVAGEYRLAAAGAKEVGAAAVRALTVPDSNAGLAVREKRRA